MGFFFYGFLFFLAMNFCDALDLGAQEDKIGQTAVEAIRTHMRGAGDLEIRFIEKQESEIAGFYAVKVLIVTLDKEVPRVIYVDKNGERVIFGDLFVKGENVTRKMAGNPKPRVVDMDKLEIDKSPGRGRLGAKLTIVEFSNFLCPYCYRSWAQLQKFMEKNPQDVRYVFKHLPLEMQGKPFEISEMAASVQELSPEAFWLVHDFLFSREGQELLKKEKEAIKQKIVEILKEKGFDAQAFQNLLDSGKGRKRLEEDMVLARKYQFKGTPTTVINGQIHAGALTEKILEGFLGK